MFGMKQKERESDTFSVKEFAELMNKDISTVYEWASQKKIPVQRASGIRIPKLEANLLRDIGILTGREININWESMKEYLYSLKNTLAHVLEQKGRGRVIRDIAELVERKK